jgi:hypothetical protein
MRKIITLFGNGLTEYCNIKEQLYRGKITILMFEITIVAIMKLCSFNSIGS